MPYLLYPTCDFFFPLSPSFPPFSFSLSRRCYSPIRPITAVAYQFDRRFLCLLLSPFPSFSFFPLFPSPSLAAAAPQSDRSPLLLANLTGDFLFSFFLLYPLPHSPLLLANPPIAVAARQSPLIFLISLFSHLPLASPSCIPSSLNPPHQTPLIASATATTTHRGSDPLLLLLLLSLICSIAAPQGNRRLKNLLAGVIVAAGATDPRSQRASSNLSSCKFHSPTCRRLQLAG